VTKAHLTSQQMLLQSDVTAEPPSLAQTELLISFQHLGLLRGSGTAYRGVLMIY